MLLTCIQIFFCRLLDVTISTFRTMMMVKKKSLLIPILAFCEVFVWFYAARMALTTKIHSILIPVFYSLGYATGTFIGGCLSRRLIKNVNSIEITTKKNNYVLIDYLRDLGYGVSVLSLKYPINDPQDLLLIDVKSRGTEELVKVVKKLDPNAFIVVKDTRIVHNGFIK